MSKGRNKMNTEETSLQMITNDGILRKIVKFFKKILVKSDNMYFSNYLTDDTKKRSGFRNTLKFSEDPEKRMLLELQEKIEQNGINEQNVYYLTKDLDELQRKKLLDLYKVQIDSLKTDIKGYKSKILKIRKNINK